MRRIVVSGATTGLGFAITRGLLEQGDHVLGISRTGRWQDPTIGQRFGDRLQSVECDLSDPGCLELPQMRAALDLQRPIDGLVNNAAMAYDDLATNVQAAPLDKMFQANVYAPMFLTKAAIRNMLLHQRAGSLVHISSVSAHTGYKGLAMYAATKGALEAYSKNVAREWGPRGIRSNCVVSGFMETSMSASLDDSQRARIYRRTSLKQPTDIESVAAMVVHLLSSDSRSITGQNLFVDAGTL